MKSYAPLIAPAAISFFCILGCSPSSDTSKTNDSIHRKSEQPLASSDDQDPPGTPDAEINSWLGALADDYEEALSPGDYLTVSLYRNTPVTTEGSIEILSVCEGCPFEKTSISVTLDDSPMLNLSIPIAQLSLPTNDMDNSGILMISSRATQPFPESTPTLNMAFHWDNGKWLIYSEARRDSLYNGGALSPEQIFSKNAIVQQAQADGYTAEYTAAHRVIKLSDNPEWIPISDE